MPYDIIDNSKIKLSEVLKDKLANSKRARFAVGWLFLTGLKGKTITRDEKTVRKKLYEIYTQEERSIEEEETKSKSNYFRMQWVRFKNQFLDEYKIAINLPKMINCGVAQKEAKDSTAIFCRAEDYYKLMLIGRGSEVSNENDWNILKLLECGVKEKSLEFPKDNLPKIEIARKYFEDEVNKREQKIACQEKIKEQITQKLKWVSRGKPKKFKKEVKEIIELLESVKLNITVHRELVSLRRKYGLEPEEFMAQVKQTLEDAKLENEVRPKIEKKYAEVIISESFK